MDVSDRVNDVDGTGTDLVGGADDGALLDAATGEPHAHGFIVMATAKGAFAATAVVVWRAAEFACPHDESVFEEATCFEVFDKAGDGFIDTVDPGGVTTLKVVVAIPTTGEDLHKARALFGEP
jgi:hypothetical protein